MLDFVTPALVLKKEPVDDCDALYTLYTENNGKVKVKATSVRKITSKLAAHLEPGLISKVRLVTKNSLRSNGALFQIVDAIKENRLFSDFSFLELVDSITLLSHHDQDLWGFLLKGNPDKGRVLALSGFGEEQACATCGIKAVFLYRPDQTFLCANCCSNVPGNLVTYLR